MALISKFIIFIFDIILSITEFFEILKFSLFFFLIILFLFSFFSVHLLGYHRYNFTQDEFFFLLIDNQSIFFQLHITLACNNCTSNSIKHNWCSKIMKLFKINFSFFDKFFHEDLYVILFILCLFHVDFRYYRRTVEFREKGLSSVYKQKS